MLIGFDKTHLEDRNYLDRMVHFFLYDYRFERVWKNPDTDIEKLSRYRAVLSPDFSMYPEMAPVMQLYNVFRNRWCGAYWASKGMRVIPTVNWGDESTFGFCFEGIEKGSVVAVSTYMASEHDNRQDQKEWFITGYNEMLRRIEPEKIICYNTPFPEMQGDIVYVDYELSSWRYMSYERNFKKEDLDAYKIGGAPRCDCDIMDAYRMEKGGGSAYGGKWRPDPNKPGDRRLIGEPGEIKTFYGKGGQKITTLIGPDGKATKEIHNSDHSNPSVHSNPHGHIISYDTVRGFPIWSAPINNIGSDFFKGLRKEQRMSTIINDNSLPEDNRFKTISEFKMCMQQGGEVEFVWNGIRYGVVRYGLGGKITLYEAYNESSQRAFETADEALEYMVGNDRLRNVITQVTVLERTI